MVQCWLSDCQSYEHQLSKRQSFGQSIIQVLLHQKKNNNNHITFWIQNKKKKNYRKLTSMLLCSSTFWVLWRWNDHYHGNRFCRDILLFCLKLWGKRRLFYMLKMLLILLQLQLCLTTWDTVRQQLLTVSNYHTKLPGFQLTETEKPHYNIDNTFWTLHLAMQISPKHLLDSQCLFSFPERLYCKIITLNYFFKIITAIFILN